MEEESVQPLKGLDVCIYYTLEEIMQNQSVFVSHAILGYMRVCFFFFFFFFVLFCFCCPTQQMSIPQQSGLNPVHLCSYEAKEFLFGLILLMIFSSSLNRPLLLLPFFHHLSLLHTLSFLSLSTFFPTALNFFPFLFCVRESPLFSSAGLTLRSTWRWDALDLLIILVSVSLLLLCTT